MGSSSHLSQSLLAVQGFSQHGTQAQELPLTGSKVQAQCLGRMGLVAPRHMESSWTRIKAVSPELAGGLLLYHQGSPVNILY